MAIITSQPKSPKKPTNNSFVPTTDSSRPLFLTLIVLTLIAAELDSPAKVVKIFKFRHKSSNFNQILY